MQPTIGLTLVIDLVFVIGREGLAFIVLVIIAVMMVIITVMMMITDDDFVVVVIIVDCYHCKQVDTTCDVTLCVAAAGKQCHTQ